MLRRLPAFAKHILQKEAVIPSGIAARRSWAFLLRFQNLNPEIRPPVPGRRRGGGQDYFADRGGRDSVITASKRPNPARRAVVSGTFAAAQKRARLAEASAAAGAR
jgi:hypothetical protein